MPGWLDHRAARRWFERAGAAPFVDPLAREVEGRMIERLAYIRADPARVLEVGGGPHAGIALRQRYAGCEVVALDAAVSLLRRARDARPLAARARSLLGAAREHFVAGDMSALPLKPAAFGLVWSNLALAWSPDVPATLREWSRVMSVGGLLMFSTYGPDTLKELRSALADGAPHVHPFVDMHDIGDALVAAGFADPVMDMEIITLTYPDAAGLLADLRATGQRNAHAGRRRALTGARRWRAALAGYAALARGGRVPATFEIVYGHAWKAAPRVAADGRPIIRFDAQRGARKPG